MKKSFLPSLNDVSVYLLPMVVLLALGGADAWSQERPQGIKLPTIGAPEYTANEIIDMLTPKTRGAVGKIPAGERAVASDERSSGSLDFRAIGFAFGTTEVLESSLPTLKEIGVALQSQKLRGYKFEVQGHTDAVGSDDSNMKLSKRRAQKIYQYLIENFNISPDHLQPAGYGESRLSNKSVPTAAENRRVTLMLIE